jgi:molecular chaperone Hsp33
MTTLNPFDAAIRDDVVVPFLLQGLGVRGRLVRLVKTSTTVLGYHAYPEPVAELLGETLALTAGLAHFLDFDGKFIVQTSGDGAVKMLVADITPDGGMRGYAQCVAPVPVAPAVLQSLTGKGYLAFTADALGETRERYQGIVALEGNNLAEAIQHYFNQSEQLPTRVILAAKHEAANAWRSAALILQKLPSGDNQADDAQAAWEEAQVFLDTLSSAELLDSGIAAERLLYRLFAGNDVRVFEAAPLHATCRCTNERLQSILMNLPSDDREGLFDEAQNIVMNCEFCNKNFSFGRDVF